MRGLLLGLAILSLASLLVVGCATNSGAKGPSTGATNNPSGNTVLPPGEVYTPPVAAPPASP
jgi:hypothetical protein